MGMYTNTYVDMFQYCCDRVPLYDPSEQRTILPEQYQVAKVVKDLICTDGYAQSQCAPPSYTVY